MFILFIPMNAFFVVLSTINDLLWNHLTLWSMLLLGGFFTIRSKFFQLRSLFKVRKQLKELKHCSKDSNRGTSPLRLYFASVGGMVGLGNLASVTATVTVGGPGGLIWLWITAFMGMLIKYAEIYLGIKYRVPNKHGGYDGGPMYYLASAFKNKTIPFVVCVLFCIYSVEVSQFVIVTDTIVNTFVVDRWLVIFILLSVVLVSSIGGVQRLANICTMLMPPFMLAYIAAAVWIIFDHSSALPQLLSTIWHSAWHGHEAVAGFAGSTTLMAAHYGVSRSVYSGDIGVGYDAIIQSETRSNQAHRQARMAVYALLTDTMICTLSIMIVLTTGLWTKQMPSSQYIQVALASYIPYVEYFISLLFFSAGFTTLVGYMVVGQKCASYLNAKYGKYIYIICAIFTFVAFSFHDQVKVMLLMSTSSGILVLCNLIGILKLYKEVKFL